MPSGPKVVLRCERGVSGSASWVSIANCCPWISRFPAADLPVWWLSYIGRMCSNSSFGEGWPTSWGSFTALRADPCTLESWRPVCLPNASQRYESIWTQTHKAAEWHWGQRIYLCFLYAFVIFLWTSEQLNIWCVYNLHLSLRMCILCT